jgi:hypothetical protein
LAEAVASYHVNSLPVDSAKMEALVGFLTSNLGEQGLPASEAAQRSEEEALGRLVIPAHSPAVVQVVVSLALASSDWRVRWILPGTPILSEGRVDECHVSVKHNAYFSAEKNGMSNLGRRGPSFDYLSSAIVSQNCDLMACF